MPRGLILFIAFALWAASLTVVYLNFRPKEVPPDALAGRQALDALFADNVVPYHAWKIFLNPLELRGPDAQTPEVPENAPRDPFLDLLRRKSVSMGAEPGEVECGYLSETLKRQGPDRVELAMNLKLVLPPGLPLSVAVFNPTLLDSRTLLTQEEGIDEIHTRVMLPAMELDLISAGFREAGKIKTNVKVMLNEKKFQDETFELPASMTGMMSPFSDRPPLKLGQSWQVLFMDLKNFAQLHPEMRAVCIEERVVEHAQISFHEKMVEAFRVEALLSGVPCWAWYSPQGRVLKQHFRLMDHFNVTLLRNPTDDPDPNLPAPGYGKIFQGRVRPEGR